MTFIPIKYNDVIANMSVYPKTVVQKVIKQVIKNPNLITPKNARILSQYLKDQLKKYKNKA